MLGIKSPRTNPWKCLLNKYLCLIKSPANNAICYNLNKYLKQNKIFENVLSNQHNDGAIVVKVNNLLQGSAHIFFKQLTRAGYVFDL